VAAAEGAGRLARSAWQAGRAAFDLLLPPTCPTCDAPVDAPHLMCAACFQGITLLAEPFCRRCGVPFPHQEAGGRARLCPTCQHAPPEFDRARAAFRYDAGSERLILPLKYADRTELAAVLALHMARAGAELLRAADLLVPVPLHRRRLFARRYNQAALLARALARRSGRPAVPDALVRRRATAALGQMSAAERAAEVADAFAVRACREPRVRGRRVLLIDDVLTSGATANACTRALRAAGATAVDVLAAARVPDPRLQ
jgi:ComF family protein